MAESSPSCNGTGNQPLDIDLINREMTFIASERCTVSCGTVCVDPHAAKVLIIFNRRLRIWQLPKGRKNIGEDLPVAALRETYEETGVHATLLPLRVRTRSTWPASSQGATSPVPAPRFGCHPHLAQSEKSASPVFPAASPVTFGTGDPADLESAEETHAPQPKRNGDSRVGSGASAGRKRQKSECHEWEIRGEVWPYGIGCPNDSANPNSFAAVAPVGPADPKLTSDLVNNELIGIVQYPDLQAATPDTIKTVFFFAASADSMAPMGPGAQEEHEDLRAEWVGFEEAAQRLRFFSEREAMWKVKQDMERSGIAL